ncbi:uncharacterized protein K489DRAFT_317974, partial [Dissoconium aciculare CBS 342.82]|uniref:PHD-type domain-containing protein n=1 Tax=Dissoconium aciculare CBS 342.82 TaxID=1314786 RepID=A0A6J3M711_9PEZI
SAMASAVSHDDIRALSRQPPADPDVHATLSDFLTYTEHFPSHLTRALTLIHEQRLRAEGKIRSIHDDTTAYSTLPSITQNRPDPVELRRRISYALEEAETACRMAVVEAERLDIECKKEAWKLDTVVRKLRAQPKPPSRDPTPEQQQLTSPNLKREAHFGGRGDESRVDKLSRRMQDKAASKLRGRKIMVPGEVLPPPDPNAPYEDLSDWTSPRASPPLLEEPPMSVPPTRERERDRKSTTTPRQRSHTPKQLLKPRGPRLPGQPGTNAHSAVAGISTSNALLALTKPPDDAPKGSKWAPWLKLTEWEMANLRKRMKKNAIWVPSQTMVRRELKLLGRGLSAKEAARAQAEAGGEPFVDEHGEVDPTGPGSRGDGDDIIGVLAAAHVAYEDDEDADAELVNRGMRLNEAKKLKRQRMQEELQEQIAREQGDDASSEVGKKISTSPEAQKKRKRDSDSTSESKTTVPPSKKIRTAAPTTSATATNSTTTKVPLAPEGVSSSPSSKPSRHRASSPPTAATAVEKKPPPTLNLRRGNKAVSEEPPTSARRANLRRGSTASMPEAAAAAAATAAPATSADQPAPLPKRRSKRPAPGIVTSSAADGQSAKGVVSQRKAAPHSVPAASNTTSSSSAAAAAAAAAVDDDVAPNEPTYCLCGDVSWGTMIACDNEEECEGGEWFHLECVGLTSLPPRRGKWFCPECVGRKKGGAAGAGAGAGG